MGKSKYCVICGRPFAGKDSRKVTCGSEECKIERAKWRRREFERREREKAKDVRLGKSKPRNSKLSIGDISVLARQEGLTYGQYVQRHGL